MPWRFENPRVDVANGRTADWLHTRCGRLLVRSAGTTTALGALLLASPAMAHQGTGLAGGFASGFLHPLTGLDHALASQRVYSDGAEILYDLAERYDEDEIGMLVVVRSGQHVFRPVVANYLRRISYDDDGWARRLVLPITERKLIAVDPWRGFGQPLFLHGGAPLDNVLARIRAGESLEDVAADFEVPREDVQEALRGAA